MDDEADYAREYERLRAELADFVLDALAQRMAAGEQPELSQALADAIDRRVDAAVKQRLAQVEWPDPDAFADQVLAAAAGRGGVAADRSGAAINSRRSTADTRSRTAASVRAPGQGRRIAIWLAGIAALLVAAVAIWYFFLRGPALVKTETQGNVTFYEPAPDGSTNALAPPANLQAPAGNEQNISR